MPRLEAPPVNDALTITDPLTPEELLLPLVTLTGRRRAGAVFTGEADAQPGRVV